MRPTLLALLFGLIPTIHTFAQLYNPVQWTYSYRLDGDEFAILQFTAKIDAGWHVYSTSIDPNVGPVPTSFDFQKLIGAAISGKINEPSPHIEHDPNFNADLAWFEKSVTFEQKVKLLGTTATVVGELTYMTCDASKCLPPEYIPFEFKIEGPIKPGNFNAMNQDVSKNSEPMAGTLDENPEVFAPVKWSFKYEKTDAVTYTIRATATIDKGWHVYSTELPNEDGPVATEMNFLEGPFESISSVVEIGELKREYDENFMSELSFFESKMILERKFKLTAIGPVKGEIYFMCCDAERCLPPETIEFIIDPASGQVMTYGANETSFADNQSEMLASDQELNQQSLTEFKIQSIDLARPLNDCGEPGDANQKSAGFWMIFLLGMLGGFVALVTPCVFPMIPLTVSFFTKSSTDHKKGFKNAVLYGLSIFLIYVVLSLPFHLLDSIDPEILNTISTNAWLNFAFFLVFVVFAISFFGYFEITLPSGIANRTDSASNIGGMLGIFFMGLTLAIVSFSCTGPILGTLLAGALSSDGGAIQLTAGMAGFGFALALPFGLFAAFPSWLHSLPKSGGWLNQVKVVLGFIEIALAIKFLSNADLVEHWNILKIEPFLIIWILCSLGIAAYLMGWIKFPHDSPNQKPGKLALAVSLIAGVFAVYMITGFRYDEKSKTFQSLTLLSGIAPSAGYSFVYPSECPLGLNCFHDYETGLAYAKENNKPILIDFTGYACVNCRRMEENVWPKPEIFNKINENYVLISLYVDDRENLPESEQFDYVTATGRKKKIKTLGDKWATLETETFATNAQPHYALISPDEILLNYPIGYTPNADEYEAFLDCGLESFKRIRLK